MSIDKPHTMLGTAAMLKSNSIPLWLTLPRNIMYTNLMLTVKLIVKFSLVL